jgi:ABC-type phosphate/phosphonate transport system substrate-binding protein
MRQILFSILALALTSQACENSADSAQTAPDRLTVVIAPDLKEMGVTPGEMVPLQVTVFDRTGAPLHGVPITFSSSDTTIVQVTANGTAQALKLGTAYAIAATPGWRGELRDSVQLLVREVGTGL